MTMFAVMLAQTDEEVRASAQEVFRPLFSRLDILNHPEEMLDGLSNMPFLMGSILVATGILCVFNGYRWHKWVVGILAFMCGMRIGDMLAEQFGRSDIVAVALGCLAAIVATPMMKIAVALFSGLTGAFIGANIWTAVNTQADLHWAGAAMGFIALAMASILLFRIVIVLFTSVGGAAMVVFGGLGLMLHVENWAPAIRNSVQDHELMIPLLVMVAAAAGFVLQQGRLQADGGGGDDE